VVEIQVFSNKWPDPLERGDGHKNEVGPFKHIFFSRTKWPEMMKFTPKIPDTIQNRIYTQCGPWESGGGIIGEIILCVYIEKNV
jgi:hypothetical protein